MFKQGLVIATLLALSASVLVGVSSREADAAAPADGVYDVAVLEVGDSFDWEDNDFQALTASEYDWEMIQPDDLSSTNLSGFDVLIIPWAHDYAWLTPGMASAIMGFVDAGGSLIIHSVRANEIPCEVCDTVLPDGFADALLAFFPERYAIEWASGRDAESVLIIAPSHPLARVPNTLTAGGLSGWGDSIHSFIVGWGEAWQWVLATDFAEIEENESPETDPFAVDSRQQGGELSAQVIEPGVDVAMVQGCATFGDGKIVISGQDPEYHGTSEYEDFLQPEALLQIENEIKIGASSCGNRRPGDVAQRQQPPNIGAGLSGLFQGQPTPLPTAPSAVSPAATSPVITPPRTGDAGLADEGVSPFYVAALVVLGFGAIPAYRLMRR